MTINLNDEKKYISPDVHVIVHGPFPQPNEITGNLPDDSGDGDSTNDRDRYNDGKYNIDQ